jgi:hypothetical protein
MAPSVARLPSNGMMRSHPASPLQQGVQQVADMSMVPSVARLPSNGTMRSQPPSPLQRRVQQVADTSFQGDCRAALQLVVHKDSLAMEELKLWAQHNVTTVGAIAVLTSVEQQEKNRVQQDVHHDDKRRQQDGPHDDNLCQQDVHHDDNRVQQDVHHDDKRRQQDGHHDDNLCQQAEFHDMEMQHKERDLAERAIKLYFNASCCVLIVYAVVALSLGAHYHLLSFYRNLCSYFQTAVPPPSTLIVWIPASFIPTSFNCFVSVTFSLLLLCLFVGLTVAMPKNFNGVLTPVFYLFACVVAFGKTVLDPTNQVLGSALLVMGIPAIVWFMWTVFVFHDKLNKADSASEMASARKQFEESIPLIWLFQFAVLVPACFAVLLMYGEVD